MGWDFMHDQERVGPMAGEWGTGRIEKGKMGFRMCIVDPPQPRSFRLRLPWWSGFALSLFLPFLFCLFLLGGPFEGLWALVWMIPVLILILADGFSLPEVRSPAEGAGRAFFQTLSLLLIFMAPVNWGLTGVFLSSLKLEDSSDALALIANLLTLRFLGGTTLCCAVFAPAHEFLHRGSKFFRNGARFLLWLIFADDFFLAHGGGHHRRLGGSEDPSTALKGESYETFFWRSLSNQWAFAKRRYPSRFRMGLMIEIALVLGFALLFGGLAALFWLYLAFVARRLLEAVNYFQHYGLDSAFQARGIVAWRSDGAVSYFLFLGLPRHSDHHLRSGHPFSDLIPREGQPILPLGYLGTAIWVKNHSGSYQRWAMRALDALIEGAPP